MVSSQQFTAPTRGQTRLPTPPRDRRGVLAILALFLVLVGALGAAVVVYRTGNRVDVLVASRNISPGQKVAGADFTTARVASDSGDVVAAAADPNFIGSFAITAVPSGTLINAKMFRAHGILPNDAVVLGVTLSVAQRPAQAIEAGDILRAYYAPKSISDSAGGTSGTSGSQASISPLPSGYVIIGAARVVAVSSGSSASADTVTVSLLLTSDEAVAIDLYASEEAVGVGELPPNTHLPIDFVTA